MAVAKTQAANELHTADSVSPHKLISLLMAGTLERVSQAKQCIDGGNDADKMVLLGKIVAIVKGLRGSLDFKAGGDIAVNLDTLYAYMLSSLDGADTIEQQILALDEISNLMVEVKTGWDGIDTDVAA